MLFTIQTTIWYLCVWTSPLPFVPIPINFIRIMCRGLLSSEADHLYADIHIYIYRERRDFMCIERDVCEWQQYHHTEALIPFQLRCVTQPRNQYPIQTPTHWLALAFWRLASPTPTPIPTTWLEITLPEIICGEFAISFA